MAIISTRIYVWTARALYSRAVSAYWILTQYG